VAYRSRLARCAGGGDLTGRDDYHEVLLARWLREAREETLRDVLENNRAFHRIRTEGVTVEQRRDDGSIAGVRVCLLDFEEPDNNDWPTLVSSPMVIKEGVQVRAAAAIRRYLGRESGGRFQESRKNCQFMFSLCRVAVHVFRVPGRSRGGPILLAQVDGHPNFVIRHGRGLRVALANSRF
jgi:hypothetical protein